MSIYFAYVDDTNELDIGNGVFLENVDKFCYLGQMQNAGGHKSLTQQ